jgi:hypothetical protein
MFEPKNVFVNKENRVINEFARQKSEIYPQESNQKARNEAEENLQMIDDTLAELREGKIPPNEASDLLYEMQWDFERPNEQIYAFESLLKALVYVEDEKTIDQSLDYALSRIVCSENPIEREYLLGILYHFGSPTNYESIEQSKHTPHDDNKAAESDEEIAGLAKIVSRIQESAKRLAQEENAAMLENTSGDMRDRVNVLQYLLTDFSLEGIQEHSSSWDDREGAKLISHFYEHEPSATRRNFDLDEMEKSQYSEHENTITSPVNGDQNPWRLVALPQGHHPSLDKLHESKGSLIPIDTFRLVDKNSYKGDGETYPFLDVSFVRHPRKEKLAELYYDRIRYYKDKGDAAKVEKLDTALRNHLWREIEETDPAAAEQLGGVENILILKKTIRDKNPEPEMGGELENVKKAA